MEVGDPRPVGEVACLAVVEKWSTFSCKLTCQGPELTLLDVAAWSIGM